MILLDKDHTTFLKYPDSERGRRMIERLNSVSASEVIGVAIGGCQGEDYGCGAARDLTLPVEGQPFLSRFRDANECWSIIVSGVRGTRCAEFKRSATNASKKSAITQLMRLQYHEFRHCAISLLIVNTRPHSVGNRGRPPMGTY